LPLETYRRRLMTNRDIGSRVKATRQERRMTTTELGRRVDISKAQISRLENGLQGFRSGTLLNIAKALGRPPFYFMMNDRQWEAYERGKR